MGKENMKRLGGTAFLILSLTHFPILPAEAQRLLTLDSCRTMALRNNKQLSIQKVKQDIAENLRRSARTKYLPHVSAIGSYVHTNREVSLLTDEQKATLPYMGTDLAQSLQPTMEGMSGLMTKAGGLLAKMGLPLEDFQQLAGQMQQIMGETGEGLAAKLNATGAEIVESLHTDTRNVWAGSVLFTQPLFLGGSL
jgi:hypothetical protein